MTTRSDIIDGNQALGKKYGLIYTRKCGWVDLGHANPEGALSLWRQIKNEIDSGSTAPGYYRIRYKQMMGRKNLIMVGVIKKYDVKKGLSIADKKSVALSIFLDVSNSFESMQSSWPFRLATNSGYSAEDLVSDLIGFYRAVEPDKQYIQICEPIKKDLAIQIWDKFGAVGDNKNYSSLPYLYPIPPAPGIPVCAQLPSSLSTIKPAQPGDLFKQVK